MADCPYCLQPGAQRFLWSVKCPNAGCPKYDEKFGAAQARAMIRPKSGIQKSGIRQPSPIAGDVDNAPASAGTMLNNLRRVVGIIMIIVAAGLWFAEKSGHIKTGMQGKNLFWLGLIGWWMIPRKPKEEEAVVKESEEESEDTAPDDHRFDRRL